MMEVFSAPDWLLEKLHSASHNEVVKICTIFYGIWYWRNKLVWENRVIAANLAMEGVFLQMKEWVEARKSVDKARVIHTHSGNSNDKQWYPPDINMMKVNVDAPWHTEASSFTIGMVIRDHRGCFIEGRTMAFPNTADVLEAELIGVKEALAWILSRGEGRVMVETDSKLSVEAIKGKRKYVLEVGHTIDQCQVLLQQLPNVSINHVRKQANKVAHELARMPCMINCSIVYASPPTYLVEICSTDAA